MLTWGGEGLSTPKKHNLETPRRGKWDQRVLDYRRQDAQSGKGECIQSKNFPEAQASASWYRFCLVNARGVVSESPGKMNWKYQNSVANSGQNPRLAEQTLQKKAICWILEPRSGCTEWKSSKETSLIGESSCSSFLQCRLMVSLPLCSCIFNASEDDRMLQ